MTAIDRKESTPEPLQARAGYLWPGLGHLLSGDVIHGIGQMGLFAIVVLALVLGLPHLDDRITRQGGISYHAVLAVVMAPILLAALYHRAHKRAFPTQLTEEAYNSNRQVFLRQVKRHRTGMLGLYGIAALLLITLMTPLIAPFDPDMIDAGPAVLAPGWWQAIRMDQPTHGFFDYPMGTDERGRDVFSRLLFGSRISLLIGFLAVGIAATIGTVVGATAGFIGGWVDRTLMWFVDLLLALPQLILLLAVVGIVDVGGVWRLVMIVAILGLTAWMGIGRIVRSTVLSLKEQDFVQAARALGYSQSRIVLRHLIPNAMAPVIVYCSLAIGSTMLAEAGLSFLGLGVQPPTSTWGVLVNEGRDPLRHAPWISLFPGFAIVLAVMCFNLAGDGLRDALDPKQRT